MKPSIPKGTRDFLPEEMYKRKYIFGVIEKVYQKYGYLPIETPALELLQTLTGKYGEEGDQLLFKVLNNGDFLAKADEQALREKDSDALIPSISKRGLRYDLTVPFARYVVMHQHVLEFPFKRYQIQPVWRADRPQKGRYREFWQCDADVVGSDALVYEAELIQIINEVFSDLDIRVVIKVNNRKILNGVAEVCGIRDRFMDMTIAIDKLDKIGAPGVRKLLGEKGILGETADHLIDLVKHSNLEDLRKALAKSESGMQGISELDAVLEFLGEDEKKNVEVDISLARGLNYYTGCIFEVVADPAAYPDLVMGSISGGGRYDDLTGVFGMKGNSGVGISFGADRIYDVMEELGLFPETVAKELDILFVSFDKKGHATAFRMVTELRRNGLRADLYPDPVKMKKQLKYANARRVPYVGIIGDNEMASNTVALKNMRKGEQQQVSMDDLIEILKG